MEWLVGGALALAAEGVLGRVGELLGGSRAGTCHCRVELGGSGVNHEILDLLRGQLERCGPDRLQCPPCPACPAWPARLDTGGAEGWASWGLAALLGALVGAATVACVFLAADGRGRSRPGSWDAPASGPPSQRRLAVQDGGDFDTDQAAREAVNAVRRRRDGC